MPADDPTLLFTNAGMVQFKKVFLGMEDAAGRQAPRDDLAEVRARRRQAQRSRAGRPHGAAPHVLRDARATSRSATTSSATRFASRGSSSPTSWSSTRSYLRVTVHHTDDEARALWREIAGLPDSRIYGLGDKDNFWQMADTGPCGPCSEIFVDLAHVASDWRFPEGATGEWTELDREEFSLEAFIEGAEAGTDSSSSGTSCSCSSTSSRMAR